MAMLNNQMVNSRYFLSIFDAKKPHFFMGFPGLWTQLPGFGPGPERVGWKPHLAGTRGYESSHFLRAWAEGLWMDMDGVDL